MEVYKTSDKGFAGYLRYLGFRCLGTVPTDEEVRRDFVFIEVDDPYRLLQDYTENKVEVKPRRYHQVLGELRHYLPKADGSNSEYILTKEDIDRIKNGK